MRLQPCLSPVWDTGLAAFAVGTAFPNPSDNVHGALRRAANWLLTKEVRRPGDWAVRNRAAEPGGWYFEFANEFYPDTDDTAQVLLALRHAPSDGRESAARGRAARHPVAAQHAVEGRRLGRF